MRPSVESEEEEGFAGAVGPRDVEVPGGDAEHVRLGLDHIELDVAELSEYKFPMIVTVSS